MATSKMIKRSNALFVYREQTACALRLDMPSCVLLSVLADIASIKFSAAYGVPIFSPGPVSLPYRTHGILYASRGLAGGRVGAHHG